MLKINAEATVH